MQVGDTVTLRVLTPAGPTDVVGTLLATERETLTVRRRDGRVAVIAVDSVRAGRVVPPGPARRISAGDLHRVMALGWRAGDVARLGEWLLRANGGFTGRANSALPVGDPGVAVDAAVAAVERWYAERGLPARIQLPGHDAAAGVVDRLDAQGWEESPPTIVMTAELGPVLRGAATVSGVGDSVAGGELGGDEAAGGEVVGGAVELRVDAEPDDAWLAAYRQDSPDRSPAGRLPAAARAVLTNHDTALFASVRDGGRCPAIARVAVDGRWAGLFGVEVDPAARRRGLGGAVVAAALRAAVTRGARLGYLQVFGANTGAIEFWHRLGFVEHHRYVYRTRHPS
ncbi:MAG TPA: GNAT family N-acetyltransferase [Mycobacteriales bacterium]|nr:GNAT family N-acetyltransferase [Mycobacteriales bacterium]